MQRPLKILYVTPHYEPAFEMGGIVKSLGQLCRGLVNLGQEITVFTTDNNRLGNVLDFPINQEVDVSGLKTYYFPIMTFDKKFFFSPEVGKATCNYKEVLLPFFL